jgi:membrane fusion protein, adhesin transport system
MKKADRDFFDEYDVRVTEKPTVRGHWILWGGLLAVVTFFCWTYFAMIDEVTRAEGKVIPSQKIQVIQNLEGGIVSHIAVKEGEVVEKGQTLMLIDDTLFSSTYREAYVRSMVLKTQIARLLAQANDQPFVPPPKAKEEYPDIVANEEALYHSEIEKLKSQVLILKQQQEQREQELKELESKEAQLDRSYTLVSKELAMTAPLVKEGAVSEVELLRIQRQANDMEGELKGTRLAIPRIKQALEEAKGRIQELKIRTRGEALDKLTTVRTELSRLKETNVALEDRVNRTTVRAPVKGTIKQLKINTIGGVVQPGRDIVEIVPLDDSLLIEAKVRPSDIAFLHPGQSAVVKFTAYDFAIYGGLRGQLEQISADTILDEKGNSFYQILVRTDRNYLESKGKKLQIIPGMTTVVDIITGEKSILSYLMKPILRAKQTALRER